MKILVTNPPWIVNKSFLNKRTGVRAGSRWPFTSDGNITTILLDKFKNRSGTDTNIDETGWLKQGLKKHPWQTISMLWDIAIHNRRYAPYPVFMGYTVSYLQSQGIDAKFYDAIAENHSYKKFYKYPYVYPGMDNRYYWLKGGIILLILSISNDAEPCLSFVCFNILINSGELNKVNTYPSDITKLQARRQVLLREALLSAPYTDSSGNTLTSEQRLALQRQIAAGLEVEIQQIETEIFEKQAYLRHLNDIVIPELEKTGENELKQEYLYEYSRCLGD